MRGMRFLWPLTALLLLGGCSWIGDLFGGEDEPPLPGTRVPVLLGTTSIEPDAAVAERRVQLPEPYVDPDWPQSGGSESHAMYHLALGPSPKKAWSADVGKGDDDDAALLSQPVVIGERIYTLDARSLVTAFNTSGGSVIWKTDVADFDDEDDGYFGGGLAYADGRLFVTTGFAKVFALDATSGQMIWEQKLPGPMRSAPTVSGGRVFIVTTDNQSFALAADDGRLLWDHTAIQEQAQLLGTASPAVWGSIVLMPYSSGEVFALQVENGRTLWSESLSAVRRTDPLSDIAQIRGLPVVDRGIAIVTSHAGRTMAIDARRGARLWDRDFGGTQTPWAAGDFVYLVTRDGALVCLTRDEGGVRWATQLPRYEDPEDLEDPITWVGPVLASDRLIVAGSHGEAYSISPYTGEILGVVDLPSGAAVAPIVVNQTLYFLSTNGDLVAMR